MHKKPIYANGSEGQWEQRWFNYIQIYEHPKKKNIFVEHIHILYIAYV